MRPPELDEVGIERLIESITKQVMLKLDGGANGNRSNSPESYSDRVHPMIAAGADRLASTLGIAPPEGRLAGLIDHTLLKPEASHDEIAQLCSEARKYGFASVCVNPSNVKLCAQLLKGSPVAICTVVGFPLGATPTDVRSSKPSKRSGKVRPKSTW